MATFTFPKLTQLLQEQSGTVAVLSLGLSLLLGWDAIARRYVLLKQETAVENAAGDADRDAVGDAEDITYQTVCVSTLCGLKRCQVLLDAGSLFNWISIEAAVEMDLAIAPVSEQEISSCSAIDAGGNEVVPRGKVAVTWFWEGSHNPQTTIFYVGLRGAFIMILGSYYLFDKKIFTYNRKFVLPLNAAKAKKEDKAKDEAAQAARNAESRREMEEEDARRKLEYEEFQKKNAGGPPQDNAAQGGPGSSGTRS